jgi:hypothetical protein
MYCGGDSINNTDPSGHAFGGSLFNIFRATTESRGASRIPGFLKKGSEKPKTLHVITDKKLDRLDKAVAVYKADAHDAKARADQQFLGGNYNSYINDKSIPLVAKYIDRKAKYEGAERAYVYAERHIGKAGITSDSKKIIKQKAQEYDARLAEIEKARRKIWRREAERLHVQKVQSEVREGNRDRFEY